jgi:hypothetical protein
LVTRAQWGDLRRGLRAEDAELADEMSRSVTRRLARAEPMVTRIIAFGSRVSLRQPYLAEVPNLWPRWLQELSGVHRRLIGLRVRPRSVLARVRRVRSSGAAAVVLLVVAVVLGSCGRGAPRFTAVPQLPERTVPDGLGDLVFQREPSLEEGFEKAGENSLVRAGQIFSIRRGDEVMGSVQLAAFKPGLIESDQDLDEVRAGVLHGIGNGNFEAQRAGADVVLAQRQNRTSFFVWFSPDTSYFQLMVAGRELPDPEFVFSALLAHQRGDALPARSPGATPIAPIDPRRGGVA